MTRSLSKQAVAAAEMRKLFKSDLPWAKVSVRAWGKDTVKIIWKDKYQLDDKDLKFLKEYIKNVRQEGICYGLEY